MDSSLFLLHYPLDVIWILVYVDNIIIIGDNPKLFDQFVANLDKTFSLKDLGTLNYFISTLYKHGSAPISAVYINDLLCSTNMLECKPGPSSTSSSLQLGAAIGNPFEDVFLYWSTIVILQYLTSTRPKISFIVNKLCQFMHNATDAHRSACKCILRYLQGSKNFGILLYPAKHLHITALQMPTGQLAWMIKNQQGVIASIFVTPWFLNLQKNKILLLTQA